MMVPRLFLGALTLSAALSAAGEVHLSKGEYDFGLMKEIAGPKTGFDFIVNDGPGEVAVVEVKPSCGCTSAEFDDRLLTPGDSARISFTYDPEMRPGRFEKTVKVRLSDGSRRSIAIRGNVLGTPESLHTLYPVDAGALRLSEGIVSAGEVISGRAPTRFFNAYSTRLDSIVPVVSSPTKALRIAASAPKAGPGDLITYSLTFDSRAYGQVGPVEIPVEVASYKDAPEEDRATVLFRAYVIPDTDALLRSQKGKNPVCDLSPDPVDLGQVAPDGQYQAVISIANNGKGPLEVFRIFADVDGVSVPALPKPVKAGKKAQVVLSIDASRLPSGPTRRSISVITNDPVHPVLTLPLVFLK